MNPRILLFTCLLLLAACTPVAEVIQPTLTQADAVDPTGAPSRTHTLTLTATNTPTLTDTPLPTDTATLTLDPVIGILIYGQKLMQERCSVCHSTERIISKHYTSAQWTSTVDRMIGRGAQLNATERQTLIDFLSISFP